MAEVAAPGAEDDGLVRAYRDHLATEPQRDAGMNPAETAHETAAKTHADWDRIARAYRVLLAPRLLDAALARLDGPTP